MQDTLPETVRKMQDTLPESVRKMQDIAGVAAAQTGYGFCVNERK